jgi:hypothetical protein
MIPQDYDQYVKLFDIYKGCELKDCTNNLLLSPCTEQCEVFDRYFNNAINIPSHKGRWDITQPNENKYDLIFAGNVLMYISESKKAIDNVLACCKWFLLQDIIIRWRGSNEFGGDGDCMRYYHKELGTKSINSVCFDISYLGDKIIYFKEYEDERNNISFITLIKGNL